MKRLVLQITRPTALWAVLGIMALAGLGSVVQLQAQKVQPPQACAGAPCTNHHCARPCVCAGTTCFLE